MLSTYEEWKCISSKGDCVNLVLEIRSKCVQGEGRGSQIQKFFACVLDRSPLKLQKMSLQPLLFASHTSRQYLVQQNVILTQPERSRLRSACSPEFVGCNRAETTFISPFIPPWFWLYTIPLTRKVIPSCPSLRRIFCKAPKL